LNEAAVDRLEFHRIRETLAEHCACSLGKRLVLSLKPTTKIALVRQWLEQVQQLAAAAENVSLPPLAGVYDVRAQVRAAAFPAPLEADALSQIAETCAATANIRDWLTRVVPLASSLQLLGDSVCDLTSVAEHIRESIDDRGQVRDHASPKLASIRRTMIDARGRIRAVFDRLLRQSSITKLLQYGSATFHDDRMVLPLKSEQRGRIPGIIHRTSDSGATLFVEPSESVELNNTLVRLRDEENKEITRILGELTQHVRKEAVPILETLRAVGVLDLIAAKVRYAKKRQCTCPVIDEGGVLSLRDARHPLLLELFENQKQDGSPSKQVVPIDVRLGDDFDVLVITGPNTGGKTVTLKTVGLLALMTQCGIPIPVGEGSVMPIYDDIFIDIGDEQSLQQSLSTFSAHLSRLLDILRRSGPKSLVLIDELGAGTDPDEGAAIGRAILTELLELGASTIVTTHLSALKAVSFSTPRVDNAAVEFDPETLGPTFHLRLGEPGNSNALIIAKRLGMPARVVKLAKSFLDDRAGALNKAIAGTLTSRREAEEARRAAHDEAVEARRQRENMERQAEELRRTQEAFERWTRWVNALRPGDEVFLRTLNRAARVVRMQLHKQSALVSAGAMDIEVPLRDIDQPDSTEN